MYLTNYLNDRNNNFNLIRFLAAFAVLLNHCFPLTGEREPFGDVTGMTVGTWAVDVFFLTSGFLVTQSLLNKQKAAEFLFFRFIRIFPALIAAGIITVFAIGGFFTTLPLASYLTHPETSLFLLKGSTLLAGVSMYLPGVFENLPFKGAVNGSLWTIIYEIKMYLLLLLIWAFANSRLRVFTSRYSKSRFAAFVCATVILAAILFIIRIVQAIPESHLNRFILMFFSGALYLIARNHIRLKTSYFFFIFSALILSAMWGKIIFSMVYIVTIGYLVFYLAFVPAGIIRRFNRLGDYSYGIYIYAFPVQQSLVALLPGISVATLMIDASFATLPFAIISWYYIENPLLRRKSFLFEKGKHFFSSFLRGKTI